MFLGGILIIDDDESILKLFKLSFRKELKNKEIDLYCFKSAREALNFLVENNNKIHSIISDLHLSSMSGLEFFNQLNQTERFSFIDKYILSGSHLEKNIEKSLQLEGIFMKPIDLNIIKETLLKKMRDGLKKAS